MTYERLLSELRGALPQFSHEIEEILLSALNLKRKSDLYLKLNEVADPGVIAKSREVTRRRASGEPLHYILGHREFLSHQYLVKPGVLIPRPETELVVARAIEQLRPENPQLGLEIGVGSGVISIELILEFPTLRMIASEFSEAAIECTNLNARTLLGQNANQNANRLEIRKARGANETLEAFDGITQADFLITNPPYLHPSDEISPEVRLHEPAEALFPAGGDPLAFYREIAAHAPKLLQHRALLIAEIANERAEETLELFLSLLCGVRPDWNRI